jgi:hypothetical protein
MNLEVVYSSETQLIAVTTQILFEPNLLGRIFRPMNEEVTGGGEEAA